MTFAEIVQQRIDALNLSVSEASNRCGFRPGGAHLHALLIGRIKNPQLKFCLQVMRGLGISYSTLAKIEYVSTPLEDRFNEVTGDFVGPAPGEHPQFNCAGNVVLFSGAENKKP